MIAGCFGLLMLLVVIVSAFSGDGTAILLLIFVVLFIVGTLFWDFQKQKEKEQEKDEQYKRMNEQYNLVKEQYATKVNSLFFDIPTHEKTTILSSKRVAGLIDNVEYYCWVENKYLCFFPCPPTRENYVSFIGQSAAEKSLLIENIAMFYYEGELYREHKISGGGADLEGAIVGGMLAGTAGAIVGGREQVSSRLIEHDTRYVELLLFSTGTERTISFSHNSYHVLLRLIPEKEKNVVEEIRRRRYIEEGLNNSVRNSFSKGNL